MSKKIKKLTEEDLVAEADNVLDGEEKKKNALQVLLSDRMNKANRVLVAKTHMGAAQGSSENAASGYMGTGTLRWISSNIQFAHSLPLFKQYLNEEGQLMPSMDNMGMMRQRRPRWSRQKDLTEYLLTVPDHRFPALSVVATMDWVDESPEESDDWTNDGRAKKSSIDLESLDLDGKVALMNTENTTLYALDGQHRLMGIKGLIELIDTGKLKIYNDDKTKERETLDLDELQIEMNVDPTRTKFIPAETMGFDIIPAVLKNETREEAADRLRGIFVSLNKNAVKTTRSQEALLDPYNGFAEVARRTLDTGDQVARLWWRMHNGLVNLEGTAISGRSQKLTTLWTLQEMAENVLTAGPEIETTNYKTGEETWETPREKWRRPQYSKTYPKQPLKDIENAVPIFVEFMENFKKVITEDGRTNPQKFRRLPNEDKKGDQGFIGHALFRPKVQENLTQAYKKLLSRSDNPISSAEFYKRLHDWNDADGFLLDSPKNIWYGIYYKHRDMPHKFSIKTGSRTIVDLMVHLLGGGTQDRVQKDVLLDELWDFRVIDPSEDHKKAMDFTGKRVSKNQLTLPMAMP